MVKRLFFMLALFVNIISADILKDNNIALVKSSDIFVTNDYVLSKQTLRNIYLGLVNRWKNGDRIMILLLPINNPEQKKLLRDILNIPDTKIEKIYIKNTIKVFKNKRLILKKILTIPYGLGIVNEEDVYYNTGQGLVRIKLSDEGITNE